MTLDLLVGAEWKWRSAGTGCPRRATAGAMPIRGEKAGDVISRQSGWLVTPRTPSSHPKVHTSYWQPAM